MTGKTPVDPCPDCGSTDPDERYCAGEPPVTDLLPCPFCGRSGPTIVGYWPDMSGLNMRVRCTCGVAVGGGIDEDADRERWNTRALTRQAHVSDDASGLREKLAEIVAPEDEPSVSQRAAIAYAKADQILALFADQINLREAEWRKELRGVLADCSEFLADIDGALADRCEAALSQVVAEDTERREIAAISATNSEAVSEALVALADGADKCAQAPHFIVQPFLNVYRKHGETIAAVRAKLGSRAP
jgi:hypothetical protein